MKKNRKIHKNPIWLTITQSQYFYSLCVLVFMIIISAATNSSFLSGSNLMTILRQASILLILSLGLTAVVITGNIDLSVGSCAALSGCICAKLLTGGTSTVTAVLLGMCVGLIVGICNGLLVGLLRLPSFVATYGMNMVVSGLATIVMNGGIIYGLPGRLTTLGIGYLGPIPIPIILASVLTIVMHFLLDKTTFGRNVYMIGYNKEAARYSAIGYLKILILSYVLCGLSGSFGGIMMTARLNAADAGMSETYGLQIVAAVVIGGTSLLGGEGKAPGTVLGAIVLTMIVNIMNINGVNTNWQNFAIGVIIILMVWIDITMRRRKSLRTSL